MEQAILAMAASSAGGVTQEDGSSGKSALRFFPGEEPSNKEVGDWLDDSLPKIRLVFGALLRNETPTHLQVYKTLDDMTGFELVPDGEHGWQPSQIAAHNRKVREAISARDRNALAYAQGLRSHKDQLAQMLVTALRPRAPLRLDRMLSAHEILDHAANPTGAHDGQKMLKELMDLRGTAGITEETRGHDRAVERMRDNPLPDGCCVRDFTTRVNTLVKHHVGHLERPLSGAALGAFIMLLMRRDATQPKVAPSRQAWAARS